MCGIVGIWGPLGDKAQVLAESCRRIRHRGPDSNGFWEDTGAELALAHVRLAIQDLTEAGHQPMVSACGRYVMVFNGEVYNLSLIHISITCGAPFRLWAACSKAPDSLRARPNRSSRR